MQAIAGYKYQERAIERLEQLFANNDYVWTRDELTNAPISLEPVEMSEDNVQSKLNLLRYLIYTEGYGK